MLEAHPLTCPEIQFKKDLQNVVNIVLFLELSLRKKKENQMMYEEICLLDRAECAVRVFLYVSDNLPGNDDTALAMIEMRAAMKALDDFRCREISFDALAALNQLRGKDKKVSSLMTVNQNGDKIWQNEKGERHREDGPAIEYANGKKSWYLNGKLHREDGPAVEYADGSKSWYLNNQLHREDGPAIEYADGDKYWYLNGKELSEADYIKAKDTEKKQ